MDSPLSRLPPLKTTSTISSRRSSPATTPLSLDLSDLPPLITPSPPSNTLLITNLDDPAIFRPENLQNIRTIIDQHAQIHSWAPLKSFRRIVVSFYDIASAKLIKQTLDGEIVMDCRVRIYFGTETKINEADQHLELPDAGKLFFISPPPSPPHGWEMRNEDPPNKEVHAEDLAEALAKLHAKNFTPMTPETDNEKSPARGNRQRSGSTTIVYHPSDHGDNETLPAISVEIPEEDICDSPAESSPMEGVVRTVPILHTSRPPVELMEH